MILGLKRKYGLTESILKKNSSLLMFLKKIQHNNHIKNPFFHSLSGEMLRLYHKLDILDSLIGLV